MAGLSSFSCCRGRKVDVLETCVCLVNQIWALYRGNLISCMNFLRNWYFSCVDVFICLLKLLSLIFLLHYIEIYIFYIKHNLKIEKTWTQAVYQLCVFWVLYKHVHSSPAFHMSPIICCYCAKNQVSKLVFVCRIALFLLY